MQCKKSFNLFYLKYCTYLETFMRESLRKLSRINILPTPTKQFRISTSRYFTKMSWSGRNLSIGKVSQNI